MKSEVIRAGIYQGYSYMVVKHKSEVMQWFCGYVQLVPGHSYIPLTKKRSWVDIGMLLWKARGKKTSRPKPNRRVTYNGYDKMDINVHGGLTFCFYFKEPERYFPEGPWIGWDYMHIGDAMFIENEKDVEPRHRKTYRALMKIEKKAPLIQSRRWKAEEVEEDCKDVIRQLKKKYASERP